MSTNQYKANMKITDNLIAKVHKLANEKIYQDYPLLDMADLSKHSEGHFNDFDIHYILEAYNEVKK